MNCDSIARWYQMLEYTAFGSALQRRRQQYLNEVVRARHVLILGDGDGRFAAEFLRQSKADWVNLIDLSSRMLALAERRICACSPQITMPVKFCQGDARTVKLSEKYDLIVSHFFLDCFTSEELPTLVARIAKVASPQAQWLISEFHLPSVRPWRWLAALLIKTMYLFFRVFTGLRAKRLPDYAASLTEEGFRRVRHQCAWGGLLVSELWERAMI